MFSRHRRGFHILEYGWKFFENPVPLLIDRAPVDSQALGDLRHRQLVQEYETGNAGIGGTDASQFQRDQDAFPNKFLCNGFGPLTRQKIRWMASRSAVAFIDGLRKLGTFR